MKSGFLLASKIFVFVIGVFLALFSKNIISIARAATLTNASATLSNPRLSYRANTTAGNSGTSAITISSSTSYPDFNTNHLFPSDSICFTNQGLDGCIGSTSYSVAVVSGAQSFSTSTPLSANVDTSGYVVATQSGSITLTFTLVSAIPAGGDIYIGIPVATTGDTNDGFPDTGTSNTTNGFDFNGLAGGSVSISESGGTCSGGWDTPSVTSSTGIITITKTSSACTGSTITVTIPNMVNPSPFITNHTQGASDTYKILVHTRDGSSNVLDSTNMVVAPIEGVLISATVDQSLSFTVQGVTADSGAYCGVTRTAGTTDSTAYAIPWGTIATANTFLNAQQILTVSTNASSGYTVTIEENDQMGLNGGVCSGASAGEADSCIKDTTCDSGSCNQVNTAEWNTATNNGLGYSLASVSGTPAIFYYGEEGRTFSARQMADQEATETKQTIMSSTVPVSANQIYVCYRISVSGTQPAGYYYNKVKYTATARF